MRVGLITASLIAATLAPQNAAAQSGTLAPSRIQTLADKLATDRSFKIRLLAAKKLGALHEAPARSRLPAIRALRLGLEDPAGIVRAMCARALAAHVDHDAGPALEQLARHDPDPAVRREARRARKRLARSPRPPPPRPPQDSLRIALGSVAVFAPRGRPASHEAALQAKLSSAVEDRIEAHRPAIFPRESARLRLDVRVERARTVGAEVRYEVKVVLLELPSAYLRHAASATARARGRSSPALEARVAGEAVDRAVKDVLATALAAR